MRCWNEPAAAAGSRPTLWPMLGVRVEVLAE